MPEPGIGRPDERVAAAQAAMTSSGSVPAGAAQYIGGSDTTDVFSQVNDPARVAQEIYAATGGLEDILSKEEFFAQNNMTLTNPYGVSRFGLAPSRIDFSDNIS